MTNLANRRDREAAAHSLALHDPDASPEAILAALDFINEDSASRHAYLRAERFLAVCRQIAPGFRSGALPIWSKPRGRLAALCQRLPLAQIAAAVLVMVMTLGLVGSLLSGGFGVEEKAPLMRFASAVGQNREIVLPDQSRVSLAGASGVAIRYGRSAREIELSQGEALFDVARDRDRPFVVRAGHGSVTAVGTAFNIDRAFDRTTITVVHGTVRVDPAIEGGADVRLLKAGWQMSYFADGTFTPARQADVDNVITWRRGLLKFDNAELAEVVIDLARYSPDRIVLDDTSIGAIRVSGIVKIDNVQLWLRGVAKATGIEVIREPGQLRLRHRTNMAKRI